LDIITLALSGIAGNDTKVCACDSENCASVLCVWVESLLVRLGLSSRMHVSHGEKKRENLDGKPWDITNLEEAA